MQRARDRGTGRLGKSLIVCQISLSLVFLFGAGLLLRSFRNLLSSDPGFNRSGVLAVSIYPAPHAKAKPGGSSYLRQLLQSVRGVPGVRSAAYSNLAIPAGASGGWRDTVSIAPEADSGVSATLVAVSPDFFSTLGIPIEHGRDIGWTDDEGHAPVAILDDGLARRLRPSGELLGGQLRFGVHPEFRSLEVVGVVRAAHLLELRSETPAIYVPSLQHPRFGEQGYLYVRGNSVEVSARAVAEKIRSLGREYAAGVKTLAQASEQSLAEERATALLAGLFAVMALLLAAAGLFGLISYTVRRRTREIGVRLALGSPPRGVLSMIVRETLTLTAAGVAIGLPCALAGARLIAHALFGVSTYDPISLAAGAIVLLATGAIAGYLPARNAAAVDPMAALKYE